MSVEKLNALLWKHFTVRRRKVFELLIELFGPIFPIIAMFLLRESLYNKYLKEQIAKIEDDKSLNALIKQQLISNFAPKYAQVLYKETVKMVIGYTLFSGPMVVFVFLMNRLMQERGSGIRELIKLCGVPSTLINMTHFLNALPGCLIFCLVTTIIVRCGNRPLFESHSNFLFLFGLFLHFLSLISAAFFFTYINKTAQMSASLTLFVYIGLWLPVRLTNYASKYSAVLVIIALLPHAPSYWLLEELSVADKNIKDINDILFCHVQYKDGSWCGSVLATYGALLFQVLMFSFGAWYLDKVRPGMYGVSQPWHFICPKFLKRSLSKLRPKQQLDPEINEEKLNAYKPYFEDQPQDMYVGIKVAGVIKDFDHDGKVFRALTDVSFNVYKGEITVLLGHNGAGKSTLISVITGLLEPTFGNVYVNGVDMKTGQQYIRTEMGLCPQHNLYFPDLNVLEHLIFFTMIKGSTFKESQVSAELLSNKLKLRQKWYDKPEELSGGMLRRLQLGCSLCGDASVLILDEPTSGLDLQARRELWDILLNLRGDRTLFLTTHFMEEADVLADRIVALHGGRLHCHATPAFLKKAFGTGFRLTIKTLGFRNEAMITESIVRFIPSAKLIDSTPNTLVYDLPYNKKLTILFDKIEARKQPLKIEAISVGITTSLEDVFMKLCRDVDIASVDKNIITTPPGKFSCYVGAALFLQRFFTLFERQVSFTSSRWKSFIIMQIILPILMLFALTILFNDNKEASTFSFRSQIPDMDVSDLLGNVGDAKYQQKLNEAVKQNKQLQKGIDLIKRLGPHPNITSLLNNASLLREYNDTIDYFIKNKQYHELLPKFLFEGLNTSSKIRKSRSVNEISEYDFFTFKEVEDDSQNNLKKEIKNENVISDADLLKMLNETYLIDLNKVFVEVTTKEPTKVKVKNVPKTTKYEESTETPAVNKSTDLIIMLRSLFVDTTRKLGKTKSKMNCSLFAIFHIFIIVGNALNATVLPTRERVTTVRHIHLMTGCPSFLYWSITYIYNMVLYFVFSITPALLTVNFCDFDETFSYDDFLGAYLILLFIGGLAFFSFAFLLTFFFSEQWVGLCLIMLQMFFGFLYPMLWLSLSELFVSGTVNTVITIVMDVIGVMFPAHVIVQALLRITEVARLNKFCEAYVLMCPNSFPKPYEVKDFDPAFCCATTNNTRPWSYFSHDPGMLIQIILLTLQFVLYTVTLILLQNGTINRWYTKKLKKTFKLAGSLFNDSTAIAERLYVDKAVDDLNNNLTTEPLPDQLLVQNASAVYTKHMISYTHALNGVSFSVKKGECVGILGVSGAGKTTLFRVVTKEKHPIEGIVYVNGHKSSGSKKKYLRSIGYCPQFFGLDFFRSGACNIKTVLKLRGLRSIDVDRESSEWLTAVGMKKYQNRLVSDYSGGMVRRLLTATSLCCGTPLTLLDEPTTGVDTAARRLVWNAMKRGLLNGRSVLFTSHSADELEILSSRVIMLGVGEVMVLGTPGELRAKYAPGNTVGLKLNISRVQSANGPSEVVKLMKMMRRLFNCTLKEQHKSFLHYRINIKVSYSRTFTVLENVKEAFPGLLEEYTVANTDLEDVFFSYREEFIKQMDTQSSVFSYLRKSTSTASDTKLPDSSHNDSESNDPGTSRRSSKS